MAAFHYVVRAKLIRHIKGSGEIDFLQFEDKFENNNPVAARNMAFKHYQNFIDVLLQNKNKKYTTDKQARIDLNSFIDPGTNTKIKLGEKEIEFSNAIGNGIGVLLIIDTPLPPDKVFDDKKGNDLFIHGIGYLDSPNSLIFELDREYNYYKFNGYQIENKELEILFCDSDEWEEGYLGNGQWLEGYREPKTHKILETPFDWSGFDKPYWWGEQDMENFSEVQHPPKSLEEIIKEGESNQVEFKPSLLYNYSTNKAGIGVKGIIAKAICAFLNSNGGFLIIGVTDQGEPRDFLLTFPFPMGRTKRTSLCWSLTKC